MQQPEEAREHNEAPATEPSYIVLVRQPQLAVEGQNVGATQHARHAANELQRFLEELGLLGSEPEIEWVTSDETAGRNLPGWVLLWMGMPKEALSLRPQHLVELNSRALGVGDSSGAPGIEEEPIEPYRRRVVACVDRLMRGLGSVSSTHAGAVRVLLLFVPASVIGAVLDVARHPGRGIGGHTWALKAQDLSLLFFVLHNHQPGIAQA